MPTPTKNSVRATQDSEETRQASAGQAYRDELSQYSSPGKVLVHAAAVQQRGDHGSRQ